MKFLKFFHKKENEEEINQKENEVVVLKSEYDSMKTAYTKEKENNIEECKRYWKLHSECVDKDYQIARLKSQIKVMEKYYELDKEPTDEIKTKIHIDLEINRLKEENMKLLSQSQSMMQMSAILACQQSQLIGYANYAYRRF